MQNRVNQTIAGAVATAVLLLLIVGGAILVVPNPINGRRVHEVKVAQEPEAPTASVEDVGLALDEETTEPGEGFAEGQVEQAERQPSGTTLSQDVQAIRELMAKIPVDGVAERVVVTGRPNPAIFAGETPAAPARVGDLAASAVRAMDVGGEPGAAQVVGDGTGP